VVESTFAQAFAHAVRPRPEHGAVFRALLLCSDGDCADLFEAYGSLEELSALACDCGCSLELIEVAEDADAGARGSDTRAGGFELLRL
jgi:hypothetical protein